MLILIFLTLINPPVHTSFIPQSVFVTFSLINYCQHEIFRNFA